MYGVSKYKNPYQAYPYDILDVHGLIEAYCPRGKEDRSHVVIPCLYRLEIFPKITNIGWGISVSEPKFTSDGVKAVFRHELPKEIG